MKKYLISLFFCVILLSSVTLAGNYQVKGDYGVEGLVYLGNTKEQITSAWGEPTASIPLELYLGSFGEDAEAYFYASYGTGVFFDAEDVIVYIAVSGESYITAEGIRISDTLDKVTGTYGSDYFKERPYDPKNDYRLRYEKLGYEFSFRDGKVIAIGVFRKK